MRHWLATLLLSALGPMACQDDPVSRAAPGPTHACSYAGWTTPRTLTTAASAPVTAQFPSIAVNERGPIVVGNAVSLFDSTPISGSAFIGWKDSGDRLPAPAGAFKFILPRLVSTDAGSTDMLWAESSTAPDTVLANDWPPRITDEIWTSRLSPSGSWTPPVRLHVGSSVDWQAASLTRPSSNGSDRAAIAVSPGVASTDRRVLLLDRGSDGWKARYLTLAGLRGLSHYPRVVTSGDRYYLAFISAATGGSDANSVFLATSADRGESWEAPHLVARSGSLPAFEVNALRSAGGILYLVWLQSDAADRRTARVVSSRDDGRTWSPPSDLQGVRNLRALRAVIDPCGSVHILGQDMAAEQPVVRLVHAVWNERWSMPVDIGAGQLAASPDFLVAGDSSLYAAMLVGAEGDPRTPFRTAFSSLRMR